MTKSEYIFFKEIETFLPLDQIARITFFDIGEHDDYADEKILIIYRKGDLEDLQITGEEAEEAYLDLLKKLPDLITVGN